MPKALQLPDSLASTSTFTIKESVQLLCSGSGFSTPLCSGQFWPGLEMGRIGLSDVFFLPINHEYEGSFMMTQKTLIDKEDIPCQKVRRQKCTDAAVTNNGLFQQDPDYSFQEQ